MPTSDNEMLEEITANFTRDLIKYKFEDKDKYIELMKRLGSLIRCELLWQTDKEIDQFLMSCWGPDLN